MALYEVFVHPIYQVYKTSLCSKATLFHIATLLLTFISPLLIAFRSQGFWIKEGQYKEQPDVTFKDEMLIILQTKDKFYAWSSYSSFNELINENLKVPFIKSRQEDSNYDGTYDSLDMEIKFPLTKENEVLGINAIILFDYKLYRFSYLEMEGLIHLQYSSPISGSKYAVVGDLNTIQKQPLGHKGRDFRFKDPIFNKQSSAAQDFDIFNILTKYSSRNVTVRLENMYNVWSPSYGYSDEFTLKMKIRYPEQLLTYSLGFWQMLKWAWIQYVSILWLFLWMFWRIKLFVFKNQIVPSVIMNQNYKSK